MSRLYIFVLWLLHFLPLPLMAPIGSGVGLIAYAALRKRRRIARTNLELCLPELDAHARERLLRRHFRCFGRALLDSTVAWWGSPARLRRVVRIEGEEHVAQFAGGQFIIFVPHFVGIELEGLRVTMEQRGVAVYVRQRDAYVDAFLKRKRERFAGTRMIARREGVKAIVRAVREGRVLQLSPDMDLGRKDAVFVPYFGVNTATVTVLSRMARLLGLRIVPLVVRQLPWGRGYVARWYPAWENYPGASVEDDTRRMNEFLEARIREMPEQYLWTHRRFKTRPPGELSLYADQRPK